MQLDGFLTGGATWPLALCIRNKFTKLPPAKKLTPSCRQSRRDLPWQLV
jgi:hypothetical protein